MNLNTISLPTKVKRTKNDGNQTKKKKKKKRKMLPPKSYYIDGKVPCRPFPSLIELGKVSIL
jgi:hypothetical protein